jgi:CO/xanthine dehydrogenase FAD-binding subunit
LRCATGGNACLDHHPVHAGTRAPGPDIDPMLLWPEPLRAGPRAEPTSDNDRTVARVRPFVMSPVSTAVAYPSSPPSPVGDQQNLRRRHLAASRDHDIPVALLALGAPAVVVERRPTWLFPGTRFALRRGAYTGLGDPS